MNKIWLCSLIEAEWHTYASVQHIYIASENSLSHALSKAFIWTSAVILSVRPRGTYFSEILCKIQKFSFKKIHFKMSSAKWWPFCICLNVFILDAPKYLNTSCGKHLNTSCWPFFCAMSHWMSHILPIGLGIGVVPSHVINRWFDMIGNCRN